MKYTKASAEVVLFDNSDVITTSVGCATVASAGDSFDKCEGGNQSYESWCDGQGWTAGLVG